MNHKAVSSTLFAVGTLGGILLGTLGTSASAHHGWSGYQEKAVTLSGSIAEVSYSNPHASIVLKTDDKTWNVVLAPPGRMQSRGLTKEMLVVGAKAQVEGYPHRTTADELRAERIVLAGKTIELR
jgi:hypothetical protein